MVSLLLGERCCNIDLRRGVDVILIFQIVSSVLSIILVIVPGHGDKIGKLHEQYSWPIMLSIYNLSI